MRLSEVSEAGEGDGDPRKRKQILDGAARVFLSQGFNGASMGEIARAAGVSKGTLYVYYQNKELLFEACVEQKRRMHSQLLREFDGSRSIEEELTAYGFSLARFVTDPQMILSMRTVMGIAEQMPELGCRFYEKGPGWAVKRLAEFLDTRVATGALAIDDTELAAAQFIDLCQSSLTKPLLFGCFTQREDLEARILRVVPAAVDVFLRAHGRRA